MFNVPLEISDHEVRSSATLTNSYVAGTVFSIDRHNTFAIELDYTKGDEDSMELKVEVSADGGSTYGQRVAESTTITSSLGTTEVAVQEYSFDASGTFSLLINPILGTHVRISVKATGGTPTGTAAVNAYASWR